MNNSYGTEKYLLIPLSKGDLADLYKLNSDPDVMKFIREPESDIEQTRLTLQKMLNMSKKNPCGFWKIIDKEIHEFIGWIGFYIPDNSSEIELSIRLHKKFWNRKIAQEVIHTLILDYFKKTFHNQIYAKVHLENIPAQKVLEKLDFRNVGQTQSNNIEVFNYLLEIN